MSFSAKKLGKLISQFPYNSIGLDALRYDLLPIIREIIDQTTGEKKNLASALKDKFLVLCDRFDGDPMTIESSEKIVWFLNTTVLSALKILSKVDPNSKEVKRSINDITKTQI